MPTSATSSSPNHPVIMKNHDAVDHMDFLIAVQNVFDGVEITKLKKSKTIELYNRVMSLRQVTYVSRPKGAMRLRDLHKLLQGEKT